ncbi:MAG: Hpt domain-containing protein, partial [Cyclobacteriaceae bacterium]
IPIIALTANSSSKDIERCLASGMNDWLGKPFTPEDLFKILIKYGQFKATQPQSKSEREKVDLSYLKKISNNDKTFVDDIINSFVNNTPKALNEIKAYLDTENWVKMEEQVHKIKPTLTMIGMPLARENAVEIEILTRSQNDTEALRRLTKEFCSSLESALSEFKTMGY